MPLAAGSRLGRYQILAPLGAGGMGEVYRAHDTRLEREVAIKVLPESVGPAARASLQREAVAAAALNHPHICTIHEFAEHDPVCFIVMELIEGRTVAAQIGDGLPSSTVIRYGVQVADALAHAHGRGVVHRDLKSANVMVTSEGRVKVLDFGIATLTGETAAAAATRMATSPGTLSGTPAYMAPEVLSGRPADRRSDIWALGVVLYVMTTGRRPFEGETSFQITSAILRDDPEPLPRSISAPLRAIVSRCLAKEPSLRYQQAGEVRAALEAAGTLDVEDRPAPSTHASNAPSVAVLPFSNMSADAEQEYFCDGITEEIINALSRIKNLRVVARTSAFAFKGKPLDVRAIAATLNVDHILEGSVRKAGSRVRIAAQLVAASDGYQLWSERFDRDLDDVFAIQDEISLTIVSKLRVNLLGHEREALLKRPTHQVVLYDLYLLGRYHWNRFTEEDARKCQDYFERAIRLDPTYAPAHAGLAMLHLQLGPGGVHAMPASIVVPKVDMAARAALAADPTNAEAHRALAACSVFHHHDWVAALRHCQEAFELEHSVAMNHQAYAYYLSTAGRHEEALIEVGRAVDLDPVSPLVLENAAWQCYLARDVDRARGYCQRSLALNPNFGWTHVVSGLLHCLNERLDDAIAEFQRSGLPVMAEAYLGFALGRSGQHERARRTLRDLEARRSDESVSAYYLALVHFGLGETDLALHWLEATDQERPAETILTAWMKVDPLWDPLRPDPRFRAIMRRMNL
jgi:serine/threonine protein kinase/Tfp pilus assembly protein PilF